MSRSVISRSVTWRRLGQDSPAGLKPQHQAYHNCHDGKCMFLRRGGGMGLLRLSHLSWHVLLVLLLDVPVFGNPKCRERKCDERNGARPFLETIFEGSSKYSKTQEIPTDCFAKRVVFQNCFELILSFSLRFSFLKFYLLRMFWAAANGGVTNGGFKGCLAALPGNRSKSAFFALFLPFSPFSGGPEQHLENPENGGKRPFSSDILGFDSTPISYTPICGTPNEDVPCFVNTILAEIITK